MSIMEGLEGFSIVLECHVGYAILEIGNGQILIHLCSLGI
jgi:hypothetical protein